MLNVLLAEDDLMIADLVEEALIANGYAVCGIARSVSEAVALVRANRPDLAVIDMRLADGGLGTDIVAQLPDGPPIGILYASGNINQVMDLADGGACIAKPFHTADLVKALGIIQRIAAGETVTAPFPPRFRLLHATAPRQGKDNA